MQEILPPLPAPRGRSDGWTAARQEEFCAALAKGSTVLEACAIVGKSSTSAYRARDRIRGFRNRWDAGLEAARPNIEAEVMRRAVTGWEDPVFYRGKQVGVRRRYSDALLRMMYNRGVGDGPDTAVVNIPMEEVEASLLRKLDALERRLRMQAEREALAAAEAAAAEAERMRAAGLCP